MLTEGWKMCIIEHNSAILVGILNMEMSQIGINFLGDPSRGTQLIWEAYSKYSCLQVEKCAFFNM